MNEEKPFKNFDISMTYKEAETLLKLLGRLHAFFYHEDISQASILGNKGKPFRKSDITEEVELQFNNLRSIVEAAIFIEFIGDSEEFDWDDGINDMIEKQKEKNKRDMDEDVENK